MFDARTHLQPSRRRHVAGFAVLLASAFLCPTARASDSLLTHAEGLSEPAAKLGALEAALRAQPDDLRIGNAFRLRARAQGRTADAVALIETLYDEHPDLKNLGTHLALAHLDGIGSSDSDAVQGGIAANQAERILNRIVRDDPAHVPALYARALSRLVWPAPMRRGAAAVRDFELCGLALGEQSPAAAVWARIYLLTGDAHAKNRAIAKARDTYEAVLRYAPNSEATEIRLALEPAQLLALVDDLYRLDRELDTDLSFLLDPSSTE